MIELYSGQARKYMEVPRLNTQWSSGTKLWDQSNTKKSETEY